MRRSTGEAIHFLKEKAKADSLLKERELQLREKEQSNSALLLERQSQMQNDMLMFIQATTTRSAKYATDSTATACTNHAGYVQTTTNSKSSPNESSGKICK